MLQFKVNNQNDLVNALSYLDSENFVMIEIDNEFGYFIIDLYYEIDNDCFSMFDNCLVQFDNDLSEMEDYITRYYHL